MQYGPPVDPRQLPLELPLSEAWPLYLVCVVLGLALSALAWVQRLPQPARAFAFILGQVIVLTAPLTAVLERGVYGAFPTPDKAGQIQFYALGVHETLYLHPLQALDDPGVRLIGVHAGHHWVTALFDLFLDGYGPINAQAILWPTLGWFAAALLLRELSGSWRTAVPFGMPFGMGLHVFRDLNWHTIEKTSVALLALYAWSLLRSHRDGGRYRALAPLLFGLMALDNLYLALVGGIGAATLLLPAWARDRSWIPRGCTRDLAIAVLGSAAVVLPLGAYQAALLSGVEGRLADPDAYLYERAMLDTFSLWPPQWNRLEVWRALNLPLIGLGLGVAWRQRHKPLVQGLSLTAALLFLLALGPKPQGLWNPVYMGLRLLPGLWRLATPEVFFEGCYLALLSLSSLGPRKPAPVWVYPAMVLGWALVVHTHPAFPSFSEFQALELPTDWAERLGLVP